MTLHAEPVSGALSATRWLAITSCSAQRPRMHPPWGARAGSACAAAAHRRRCRRSQSRSRPSPTSAPASAPLAGAKRCEHLADDRLNAHRRRFEIVAIPARAHRPSRRSTRPLPASRRSDHVGDADQKFAVAQAERLEHILGRDRNARIDQHARHLRQAQRQQRFADAGHVAGVRGETHRHVGAGRSATSMQARIVERKTVEPAPAAATPPRHRPNRRRCRPRPAAPCRA